MSVPRCPSWPLGEIIALDVVGSAVKRCVVEDLCFILGLDTWLAPLTPRCQLMGRRPVEILTGPGRRPTSAVDDKAKTVAGTTQPPMVASNGARRWRVTAQKLFDTRRQGHGVLAATRVWRNLPSCRSWQQRGQRRLRSLPSMPANDTREAARCRARSGCRRRGCAAVGSSDPVGGVDRRLPQRRAQPCRAGCRCAGCGQGCHTRPAPAQRRSLRRPR
jgi:hypothetical protein